MKKMNVRLLRMISHHKGQFIAVTLVIAIGLMTYVAFNMAMVNLENSVDLYYERSNFSDIYVEMVRVPAKVVREIESMPGVAMAEGRILYDVPLKVGDGDEKVSVRMISVADKEENINSLYHYDKGVIRNEDKDIYVFQLFAKARGLQVGDTLTPQVLGETYDMTVRSIVSSPEFIYLMEDEMSLLPAMDRFGAVWVTESFAMKAFGMNGHYNQILVTAEPGQDIDRLRNKLESRLDRYGIRRMYDKSEQLSARLVKEEIKGGQKSAQTVPFIFLGVAAAIMGVMISRTVRNDRTSIGVFKSMGYTDKQIMWHYTKYCALIGMIGAIIGVVLGSFTAAGMTNLYTSEFFSIPYMRIRLYPQYMALAILLSSVFTVVAGLLGSKGVLKVHPADSMRPEPPKQGHRTVLENTVIWKWITFSEKMVLRNLLRSKKRTLFIVLGIGLTYAIMMIPVYQTNAFDDIFVSHYRDFLKMDYNVNFSEPVGMEALRDIRELVDTQKVEPKLEYPFEVESRWKKKIVTVVGLPRETDMYGFVDLNKSPVKLPREGVFITEGLARYLDVGMGDTIQVNTFIPGREDVDVTVAKVIKQSLGLNMYMDLTYMQDAFLDRGLINGAHVNTHDAIKSELEDVRHVASVQSMEDLRGVYEEFMQLTLASVGILVVFSGILGFAIVYNSTIMSILERRLEFSSLRIMGFSKNEIFWLLLRENLIMTVFGIMLGIPVGTTMIQGIAETFSTELYQLDVQYSPADFILTGALTLAFVILAQVATYSKVQRLDFIEALKNRMT